MSLAAFGKGAVLVAIDGSLGNAAKSDVRLLRFSSTSNVLAFAEDFHFRQRQHSPIAWQCNTHISTSGGLLLLGRFSELLGQTVQQRFDSFVQRAAETGIRDDLNGVEEIIQ